MSVKICEKCDEDFHHECPAVTFINDVPFCFACSIGKKCDYRLTVERTGIKPSGSMNIAPAPEKAVKQIQEEVPLSPEVEAKLNGETVPEPERQQQVTRARRYLRRNVGHTAEWRDQVGKMLLAGKTYREISDTLGATNNEISKIKRELGMKPPVFQQRLEVGGSALDFYTDHVEAAPLPPAREPKAADIRYDVAANKLTLSFELTEEQLDAFWAKGMTPEQKLAAIKLVVGETFFEGWGA